MRRCGWGQMTWKTKTVQPAGTWSTSLWVSLQQTFVIFYTLHDLKSQRQTLVPAFCLIHLHSVCSWLCICTAECLYEIKATCVTLALCWISESEAFVCLQGGRNIIHWEFSCKKNCLHTLWERNTAYFFFNTAGKLYMFSDYIVCIYWVQQMMLLCSFWGKFLASVRESILRAKFHLSRDK